MEISSTYDPKDRNDWRNWLQTNHYTAQEIWLLLDESQAITYLDAVEEAICFGWIDSIQKRFASDRRAQRFTPRRKQSNWTELNKERARRLIKLGLMTEAGQAILPDLDAEFTIAPDIINALKSEPLTWSNFADLPPLYVRVRIGYIEEKRRQPQEFQRRLQNFIQKTAQNKLYGNWNDGGRLINYG